MKPIDQCPSTRGKRDIAEAAPELGKLSGRAYWRSLDEYVGTPAFKEFVEREFPAGASELLESSRRSFLKVMGAGFALAGAATIPGCRRPERHIMTYANQVPEEVIPGKALYYATAMPLPGGGAEGLLVETHTGRPTKIEGNPLHPVNRGRSTALSQASVLDLYDPDRLKYVEYENPVRGRLPATIDDFKAWAGPHFARFDETRGRGLAFIADKKTSPSRDAMRDLVLARWPQARWVAWNAAETRGQIEGTRAAFGRPMRVHHDLRGVRVVLSLDADFMDEGSDSLVNARAFGATRMPMSAGDPMSRLYQVESRPTGTGSIADHRFRLAPSRIAGFVVEVAKALGVEVPAGLDMPAGEDVDLEHVRAIAADLRANQGHAVVIAGPGQPAAVHALVAAINSAAVLGAAGSLVSYMPMHAEEASDASAGLTELTRDMRAGRVDTLVCIDANPLYDAPADVDFAGAWAEVGARVTLSVAANETAAASTWSLNGCHYLEAWGDVEAADGTLSIVQPMIAPLYGPAFSELELLSFLAGPEHGGSAEPDGYDIVAGVWASRLGVQVGDRSFVKQMRQAMHDGMLNGSAVASTAPAPDLAAIEALMTRLTLRPPPSSDHLEVVFHTGRLGDGRHANNGWLQELPELGTQVVWDNPVCMSPKTAEELGLLPRASYRDKYDPYTSGQMPKARVATMTLGGHELDVAVWLFPGMPDNTVACKLGYGRTVSGLVGEGVGWNTYRLRDGNTASARGARLADTGRKFTIVSTQNHWSLEGRTSIVRAMDKPYWDKHGGTVEQIKDEIYGTHTSALTAAEMIGEMSHTPPNVSLYTNPQNRSKDEPDPENTRFSKILKREVKPDFAKGPQWGMSIDLGSCTGCGTCTIACQSENNIPIVGKSEVAKGREMSWVRVDRYFVGDDLNNPDEIIAQPVSCVHCENAPCETVCPVNATVHGPEGTNDMAYNRCIGTRYCANNCPYKVRRFNFFEYGIAKFRGGLDEDYVPESMSEGINEAMREDRTFNQNFIPPRLREKVDEIERMQKNPDVTIRSRGVMEKCSYCIQRINKARQEVKVKGLWNQPDQTGPIPDGFFQAACQQACPSDSIVFGDVLDPNSRVSAARASGRTYMLLGYLNTRPRTTYAMRVRNPNPAIRVYDEHDPLDHGGHDDKHDDGSHEGGHASAFIDSAKRYTDEGYAASLRVLS